MVALSLQPTNPANPIQPIALIADTDIRVADGTKPDMTEGYEAENCLMDVEPRLELMVSATSLLTSLHPAGVHVRSSNVWHTTPTTACEPQTDQERDKRHRRSDMNI